MKRSKAWENFCNVSPEYEKARLNFLLALLGIEVISLIVVGIYLLAVK